MRLVKEFEEFLNRGNAIELAIGVVIGGAFGKIVSSLVGGIILPPLGWILNGVDLKELKWGLISYGNFLQAVLEFLIIAIVIFSMVKILNRLHSHEAKTSPKKTSDEAALLKEIRDLLKKRNA